MDASKTTRLFDSFARYGARTALFDAQGRAVSYATLHAARRRAGAALAGRGKKLVFVPCRNDLESIVGYVAAVGAGHAVMMADAAMPSDLRDRLLDIYDPDCVWAQVESDAVFADYGFQARAKREDHDPIHPSLTLLLSTSGSTGSPKHVRLTGENVASNAESIAQYLGITANERPITNLPIHYSYGLSIINSHLSVGATVFVTALSVTERRFWDFFRASGCTSLAGVPYTYEMLGELRFAQMTLPTLRTMTQAGGRLGPSLAADFAELSRTKAFQLYLMYGQTEATARMAYLAPSKNLTKPGFVGSAIPNGQLVLEDGDGRRILRAGEQGQIVYRGPNVMMGYATGRGELGFGDELGGVLHTGDIGTFDDDGDFRITGRLRRFVKLLGRRVNLDELEARLNTSGHDVACGGTDEYLLVATTQSAAAPLIKRQLLSWYKISPTLVRIVEVGQLSRTSSGKINYDQLFSERLNGVNVGNQS